MAAFITVNGVEFPPPKRGVGIIVTTIVDSARNANGVVVGQRVGRDQYKISGTEWAYLKGAKWAEMLSALSDFFVNVRFPDPVNNKFITLQMYTGDRQGEPYWLDPKTKLPIVYVACKANLIDVGK
jgi:hypothetical protein